MKIFYVGVGGFIGTILRYSLGEWLRTDSGFPVGTLTANLIGCFILGWFITFFSTKKKIRSEYSALIGTGLIGSFTTFSTFSVEMVQLILDGNVIFAIVYILSSIFIGLLLAFSGSRLALGKCGERV